MTIQVDMPTWTDEISLDLGDIAGQWILGERDSVLPGTSSHTGCPIPSGQIWTHVYTSKAECT